MQSKEPLQIVGADEGAVPGMTGKTRKMKASLAFAGFYGD
jgi:hypothetical protein